MNLEPGQNNRPDGHHDDELNQLLLELHYGLLEDDEVDALQKRIQSEPKVARLWADTLVIADKFAAAAKVSGAKSLDQSTKTTAGSQSQPKSARGETSVDPQSTQTVRSTPPKPTQPSNTQPSNTQPSNTSASRTLPSDRKRFAKSWLLTLVTAASIAFVVCTTRYWNSLPHRPSADVQVALQPSTGADARSRNEFYVFVGEHSAAVSSEGTFDASMPIVPATISFQVISDGAVLFFGETETSDSGPSRIVIPDEVAIPGGAVLSIDASVRGSDGAVQLSIPLEPTRCLTYLSTDRPVYRPGESVFFRSVTLNRRTLESHLSVPIRYELLDPSGASVEQALIEGVTERGVGNGSFIIPESAAGGTYTLNAHSLDGFFPDQSLEIEVRRYRAVRLKTDLQFEKRSFSAGETVQATLTVRRADDQIPVAAAAKVTAIVDGETVHQSDGTIDLDGSLKIQFDLPKVIRGGEGILSVAIDDGSVTETAVRPIPIHTGRADVEFYPEGGYLVGGIKNRVYFSARDTDGKPIEIEGEILSQAGRMVTKIKTVRDGMGRFEFNPESGQRYSLRITSPRDITETPWLPSVVEALPVLDTHLGVFDAGAPLEMTVRSTKRRQCIIRAVCRGEMVGAQTLELGIGDNDVVLPIQERTAGVVRVTVLDAESAVAEPLVERLVYRRESKRLSIAATLDEETTAHQPGDSVRMTIAVTDEDDQPVIGAVLGVSVVDDTALSLRRQERPTIETHFLLTSEVDSPEDLEHANFYLADGPEAAESLDLLLGTQGWRRFVSGSPDQINESFRDSLTRLLELDGRRSGLIAESQSNAITLAEQMRQYRRRAMLAWNAFVVEIRIVLLLIGAIWCLWFLFGPRRSTAPVAGMLLVGVLSLIQFGCGAESNRTIATSSESADMVEVGAMPAESSSQKMMGDSADEAEEAADASFGSPSPSENRQRNEKQQTRDRKAPFVERVVRSFLGQRNENVDEPLAISQITADQLRQWARSRDVNAQSLADKLMEELRFPIRQYAHIHRASEQDVRSDFTETLYWNPMMVTDSTGTVSIRFDLSDSLTLFRVRVDGHAVGGRLGSGEGSLATRIPLSVDPKVPLEVTGGDRIDLPVGLINGTEQASPLNVTIETDAALELTTKHSDLTIASHGRITKVFPINVGNTKKQTDAKISVAATMSTGSHSDRIEREIRIVPDGFPFEVTDSASMTKSVSVKPRLPDSIVKDSLSGSIEIYPSTQSQLSAGLQSILREPHGCFEQASASNYPNVMVIQLMQLDGAVDPSTRRRSSSLLQRGYQKLTSYECRELGYEWFGNDPGHEALSAFGLMQFAEMAEFVEIDREMLERTRKWLLGRRDGRGGFKRNQRHLHVWSVDQKIVNAYLLWALSQADRAAGEPARTETELAAELDQMQQTAVKSDDPYLVALSAITLANVGRTDALDQLLSKLQTMQSEDGSFDGRTTITQSGGISRKVETTALAVLALARSDRHFQAARKATLWLVANRRGGGFGSTQATVLALKALIVMHQQMTSDENGSVDIILDGEKIDTLAWTGHPADGLNWEMTPQVIDAFEANPETQLQLACSRTDAIPVSIHFQGRTIQPQSDANCPITIDVAIEREEADRTVSAGETVEILAQVRNRTDQGRPMTVAVIGLPGGLEPVIEKLEDLRSTGDIDYYELRGREVVLYWRTFAPQQSRQIVLPCVAEIGGRYTGPPSRAYLYYTAESKTWHDPLKVSIR